MLIVREIIGRQDEPRFAERRVERLAVAWDEAPKRRLRRTTDAGTDVAVDLPRGSFLADGAVLDDDGRRVIVAGRTPEPALLIRFQAGAAPGRVAEQALRLGHAFGNQHVPVEIEGAELRVPITTSEAVARRTVDALALDAVSVETAEVALAREAPLATGHAHDPEAAARGERAAGAEALLAALQLGDSALPVGRFVHSHGVEDWLGAHPEAGDDELLALVEAAVGESVGPLDAVVLALSHRTGELDELERLDALLTARKLTPAARAASQACGRRLAALAGELTPDRVVARLAARVRSGDTDGNLAVVEGALARGLGIPLRDAVLVELRGASAGLLSAAIRLGRLTPMRAQALLCELAPALERAADQALALGPDDLRSGAFELEVHAMAHRRAEARLFST